MTDEDDAFIRTIVDSPGHDLPRLVYADWLDDRDDPRGPFLRAEVEWAQPWKDGIRPGDDAELRAMATNLDPLWVARVARPPVGVCCDHVTLTDGGRLVSASELADCERRLQVAFGAELTALLLNRNGGRPAPPWFVHPKKRLPYSVGRFLPVTANVALQSDNPLPPNDTIETRLPILNNAGPNVGPADAGWSSWARLYVPFAFDGEHRCLAVGLKDRRAGNIYLFSGATVAGSPPRLVANSLADFLSWMAKPSWA